MIQLTSQAIAEPTDNLVDRASDSADKLLEAGRQKANAAIDNVADTVHNIRDKASPALDRLTSPLDTLALRTREAPLRSLLVAAATGAVLMAVVRLIRTGR